MDRGDHQIAKLVKDLQSSALPQSQNVSTDNATSSRSKAGRGRHASNSWGWASIISFILLLLFIAGIGLVWVADRQSLSVGMQKSMNLASQAWLGAWSASAWMMYTGGRLYQRVPPLQVPRNSSREAIGSALGETYTGLSQALVARNLLHDAPELLRQKRREAMRLRLPEDSVIANDLRLFLQLTQDADDDMLEMKFRIYQVARVTLRQQRLTQETLSSIQQRDQYWSTFGPFATFDWLRIYFMGISTQEAELRTRLTDHVELMYEKIIAADASTHRVLQRFYNLAFTTENIRQSCLQEEQRLLSIKGVTASHINWLIRAAMQYGILLESEEIAKISRNVERADDIHEWSKGIIKLLEHITIHLEHAKVQVGSLMEILKGAARLHGLKTSRTPSLRSSSLSLPRVLHYWWITLPLGINYSSPGTSNGIEPRASRDREATV